MFAEFFNACMTVAAQRDCASLFAAFSGMNSIIIILGAILLASIFAALLIHLVALLSVLTAERRSAVCLVRVSVPERFGK